MSQIIQCPSCRQQVNLPDELIGKRVQCPECGVNFIAIAQTEAGAEQTPVPLAPLARERPAPGDLSLAEFERETLARSVRQPAICLLLVGGLGLILSLISTAQLMFIDAETRREQLRKALEPWGFDPEQREQIIASSTGPTVKILALVFFVVNSVITLGGLRMYQLQSRTLATTASMLAIINLNNGCCLLGLPIGIWCLLALSKPGVRELFLYEEE